MALVDLLLLNFGIVIGMMLGVWGGSVVLRKASIVDVVWGTGFVLIAWASFLWTGAPTPQKAIIVSLTSLWGLRLTGYLAYRNFGQPEDWRYRKMRERHGKRFPLVSLVTVFGLQGVLMWVVSLPLQTGQLSATQGNLNGLTAAGIALWGVGVFFESVGDWQLARFKSNPKNAGQVFDGGLWRYTRHPNYFGDFLVWWGLYCVAFGNGSAWWSVIGPIVMSVLLMRVSGVTLLESSLKTRKTGYGDYIRRTSAFFPLPPKRSRRGMSCSRYASPLDGRTTNAGG